MLSGRNIYIVAMRAHLLQQTLKAGEYVQISGAGQAVFAGRIAVG